MKKIAIQTLRLSNNYGGILQAFALQFYLENLGFQVIHISRKNTVSSLTIKIKILLHKIYYQSFYNVEKKVNLKYSSFIDKYIKQSNDIFSLSEWREFINKNRFDLILVGSDQVWRLDYIKTLYPEFFLDFDCKSVKKASYAASFGISNFEDFPTENIRNLLLDFSEISVREDSAQLFLKTIVNQEVQHHIDPTLLLTSEQYIDKFGLNNKIKNNEVFCYVLDKNIEKQNIINNVTNKLSLDLNFVYGAGVSLGNYKDPDILVKPSIEAWLQNFLSAEYIITDSFHGMVFSIIFNKPFLVIANIERGVSRFTSLLKILGLEERLISLNTDWDQELLNKVIDYEKINKIINDEREKSKNYLLNLLK